MMITAAVTNIILAGGFLILKYLEMAFQTKDGYYLLFSAHFLAANIFICLLEP